MTLGDDNMRIGGILPCGDIVIESTFSVHSIHCDLNTVKHCMYVWTQDRRAGGQDSGMESVIHHNALGQPSFVSLYSHS